MSALLNTIDTEVSACVTRRKKEKSGFKYLLRSRSFLDGECRAQVEGKYSSELSQMRSDEQKENEFLNNQISEKLNSSNLPIILAVVALIAIGILLVKN